MGAEEIGVDATSPCRPIRIDQAEDPLDEAKRPLAVAKARPQGDLPCKAPAGAVVAPDFERTLGRFKKLGRRALVDQFPGVDTNQVGKMAMLALFLGKIVGPLFQPPFAIDTQGKQALPGGLELLAKFPVNA